MNRVRTTSSLEGPGTSTIRILIVDDSLSVCRVLASYLSMDSRMQVVGMAHHGDHAIEMAQSLKPDVITLDLDMPGLDGLTLVDRIVSLQSIPIVVLSGVSGLAASKTIEALNRGAVEFLPKYTPGTNIDVKQFRASLITKIRIAAGVKVIRNVVKRPSDSFTLPVKPIGINTPLPLAGAANVSDLILIGASTGGPAAIRDLLMSMPEQLNVGLVIVQHLPLRFTQALAQNLCRMTLRKVREAKHGDTITPDSILVAPGDCHLTFSSTKKIQLEKAPVDEVGPCPSIDLAMESAATVFRNRATGILLTGMGEDGACGLAAMRRAGATTYAQDESSCVVFGMPQRAIEINAASVVDSIDGIAKRIFSMSI